MKKRILSILLCLCMVASLLPTMALAAGNTITPSDNTLEALRNAFATAQNGDTIQLTGDITSDSGFFNYIKVNKAVTVDFSNHTIEFKAAGKSANYGTSLFDLVNGGSLTLKGGGGVTLSGDYSGLAQVNAGGKIIVESGTYLSTAATNGNIIVCAGGAVDIKGGALTAKSAYSLALVSGTANISGGTVAGDGTFALVSFSVPVTISGGTISSNYSSGSIYVTSGGSINMTGGKIENTDSGVALILQADAKSSTISGGQVTALSGVGVFSAAELSIASGAVINSDSGVGLRSDGTLTFNGGSVSSKSGVALANAGSMTMKDGIISSGSGCALLNTVPSGKSASVTGGSFTSDTGAAGVNYDAGALNISGGSFTTTGGNCAVYNNAAGTVNITGGTLSAKTDTLVNNGAGTIKFSSGTIASIVNYNASGSIIIDGGSVKAIQGVTPKNSAGTALRQYPVLITGKQNTAISDGELIFTPAVNYSFAGIKTDANGAVYLWLPANETSAVYKTGNEDAKSGGVAGEGKTTILPNFTATVKLKLDNAAWAKNPKFIILSESSINSSQNSISPDGGGATNGVFTFSGLDKSKSYYIWAPGILGNTCIGTALTKDNQSAIVDYYTVTLAKGEGISFVPPDDILLKGTGTSLTAYLENGYVFKNWVDSDSNTFSKDVDAKISNIAAPLKLTAVGELKVYDAKVTVNKDDKAWTDTDKIITLSTAKDNIDTDKKNGTVSSQNVSFTGLDPRVTYYVWADGVLTDQTITNNNTAATLDFYTVTVVAGANIDSVKINNSGSSLTVLKGDSATVTATVKTGDFVFSRWNVTADSSLYSTTAETTISNITTPISLTAVGASTTYTATVTLNKDDNLWKDSPHKIVLSTSDKECGNILGTLNNGVYTFSKLSKAGSYFVWDADTVTYMEKTISVGDSASKVTLEYYSVNVDNKDTKNITAVTGAGVYIKGSNVTLTATPAQYYKVKWNDDSAAVSKTLKNLSAQADLSVTGELAMYTGKVTLKLDDTGVCAGKTVTLQAGTDTAIGTIEASGVYSSVTTLDPTKTYKVLVDGTDTGASLTGSQNSATVQYYTVSVTEAEVANIPDQIVLAGKDVTFTASPNGGTDFFGWYDAQGKLLSTNLTFTLSGITGTTTLIAKASSTFDAVVTINGANGRTITLQSGSDTAVSSFTGLNRTKTYRVLDGGADTGFTVCKNAPNVTLQYYTVNLTSGTGINASSVKGSGAYLAGSSVPIEATADGTHTFSGWSGTESISASKYTIPAISKGYDLTANATLSFTGTVSVADGDIVIEDDTATDHEGKIRITVGGKVLTGGDNLAPNTNITITGGTESAPASSSISVTTQYDVFLTLNGVSITCSNAPPLKVTGTGTLTVDLIGSSKLTANEAYGAAVDVISKANLILQSSNGDGSFFAVGSSGYSGGGGINSNGNITINSGTIYGENKYTGAGIGGNGGSVTINGGTVTGMSLFGAGIGTIGGFSSFAVTINGGTVTGTSTEGAGIGAGTCDSSGGSATVIINGGTVTGTSSKKGAGIGKVTNGSATVIINGGNISGSGGTMNNVIVTDPKNAKGEALYKTAFTAGTVKDTDVSKTLTIRDKNGTVYGMNDVKTFDNGNVYAYLPADAAGATYTGDNYAAKVTTDGAGVFTMVTADSSGVYTVSIPAPTTTEGVTASGTLQQVIPAYAKDATVTVNVTLSGTALKSGTYTVGLTGTTAGTITAPAIVKKIAAAGATPSDKYTFTFQMPAKDVPDLAVTLSFEENTKYTVTYSAPDATGGSVPTGGSYFEEQNYTVSGNTGSLVKTGYTFASWDKSGQPTMGTENVILTAQWTPITYNVKFHSNYGTETTNNQTLTYNTATNLAANTFSREGYSFAGWSDSATGAKKYSDTAEIKSLTAVADTVIDLYALWTPKIYTVTFSNGGGSGIMYNQSFARDTAQELSPNAFTKTGYTFAGWMDGSNKSYLNGKSIAVTDDVDLTAQWTPISYNVKFDANGGTGSISNQSFIYGTAQKLTDNVNVSSITRSGYTFTGWNTAQDGKGTSYVDKASVSTLTATQNGTVTLYASWTANTYTVKFDKNSSDATGVIADQTLTFDSAANLTQNTAIIRKGYTFSGWNTATDGGGITYADQASVKNLTAKSNEPVTLYAMWTPDVYTITFAANDGTGTMANQIFATGNTAAISANAFTKAGYSFNGWMDDKTPVAENATVDTVGRTATISAQWTANSYTVKFHANGGTGSISDQSFTYDVPQNLTANTSTITRTGYKFSGWSDSPSATTATYSDQANVSNLTPMKDGSVTLYAVWQSDTYKVSFIANSGTGLMADLSITNGESKALTKNEFTRDSYKFSGWNTRADGTGTYYPDGATVSFTPDASGIVILYAVWTEAVRYNINGNVETDATPKAAVSGADVTLRQGSTVIASTKTNVSGAYSISNILPGLYNLVITNGNKTVTQMVEVVQADVTSNVTLPTAATINSVLEVKGESGVKAPDVVVGGLDELAKQGSGDIIMTVTAKAEDKDNEQQTDIKTAANGQKLAQFLDITLKKGASDIGGSNNAVLEIIQPFSFNGKTDVVVWRYHGGNAQKLKQLEKTPIAPFEDGTYFADSQNGLIYIYAAKFSTYAVSYQEVVASSGGVTASYSVTVNASENGTVKTDKTAAAPGDKVTVTAIPSAGYMMKSLSITDVSGKSIAYTDNRSGTFTFTMPNSNVTVSAKFAKQSENPFVDVADNAYYYDAVLWAVSKGITNGTSATTFSPGMTCTRAQTVTFLWRAMGSPEPTATSCPFTDVTKEAFFYKAVLWATEKGITMGTSATAFSPNDTVTRGQTATFLWRTAGKSAVSTTNPFGDVSSDAYYADAVLWAVSEGITTGTSAATFSPADGCTRAQIVAFLYRYLCK